MKAAAPAAGGTQPCGRAARLPPVAGLHKLSCLDYPGLPAAVIFLQGCNFHCPYCHNPHLIDMRVAGTLLDAAEILAFLRKRFGVLKAVVLSGGEPCLHGSLPDLCRAIKALGYSLKLDSNGSRPRMLARLLEEGLLDYVALDLKTAPEGYPALCAEKDAAEALRESLALVRRHSAPHELRSTCAAPFVTEALLPAMAGLAGNSPWYLQKAVLDDSMRARGLEAPPPEALEDLAQRARNLGAAGARPR